MNVLFLGPPEMLDHVKAAMPGATTVHLALDGESVDSVLPEADVVLDAYMKVPFDARRLSAAARLKLFLAASTGADHIDSEQLSSMGVPLMTLAGQTEVLKNLTPAAEHSWLLLMACARGLRAAQAQVLAGGWDRNRHPGLMLRGRTLGLVGCGRIGQWMGRYAHGFEMNVIGYDPGIDPWPEGIERVGLDQLLPESDFVSVHVPLNEQTRHLLGADEIGRMTPGAVLVNTSRGGVIDEAALLGALEGGSLGAVGLDVLSREPDIEDDPLVQYARANDNLVITPHIGGFSPDALREVLTFTCQRATGYFDEVGWPTH